MLRSKGRGLLAAALLFAAPAAAAERTVPVDELVSYFDTIVFGSEFADVGEANPVVTKWAKSRLTVSLMLRATEQHLASVQKNLDDISKWVPLKFVGVPKDKGSSADIQILFVNGTEMGQVPVPEENRPALKAIVATNPNCFFLNWKQPKSRIVKALIVANVDRDIAVLNSCLLEELTQSLGLPNDSDQLRPSIFSDKDRLYELAPQDRMLLYALYHPMMKAGLPRKEALEVARDIFTRLASPAEPSTSHAPGG